MIVEVGDFERFEKAPRFAAFLGLVPSEDSSSDNVNRYSITKAGNSHLRRLIVETFTLDKRSLHNRSFIMTNEEILQKLEEEILLRGCSPIHRKNIWPPVRWGQCALLFDAFL